MKSKTVTHKPQASLCFALAGRTTYCWKKNGLSYLKFAGELHSSNFAGEVFVSLPLTVVSKVVGVSSASSMDEVKQKYLDFCHIYTDGSKVETKVASAYVCPYGTRGYRLKDGCSIFTAEVEAINKALTYVKVSTRKSFVIFSDSMSVLQAIESQESKNPFVNRVLQACQKILSDGKFITFCWLPSHRDIRGNEDADRAAKDALSKAQPEKFELPCGTVG